MRCGCGLCITSLPATRDPHSGSQQVRQTKLTILSPGAGTRNELNLDGDFLPVDRRAAETRKDLGFAPIGVMCSGS